LFHAARAPFCRSPVARPGLARQSAAIADATPENTMQLTPVIAIHMTAALGAIVTGPVALWARQGRQQHPRLHRAFGHAFVTLMVVTAISALFIRDFRLPNIAGYTPIHVLVPISLLSLVGSFVKLARGDIAGHRSIMRKLYFGACLVAGAFTLLPGRYLGNLVWGRWFGLIPPDFQPPAGAPPVAQWIAAHPAAIALPLALAGLVFLLRRLRLQRSAL
jgi:uncharacterized membrane protein